MTELCLTQSLTHHLSKYCQRSHFMASKSGSIPRNHLPVTTMHFLPAATDPIIPNFTVKNMDYFGMVWDSRFTKDSKTALYVSIFSVRSEVMLCFRPEQQPYENIPRKCPTFSLHHVRIYSDVWGMFGVWQPPFQQVNWQSISA